MAAGLEFLLSGIVLGLAAGLSPGPLIALIVSETLKYGRKEGINVAVSPLMSDSLIIIFTVVVLSTIVTNSVILGAISLLGACFLIYLGMANLRARVKEPEGSPLRRNAFLKGVITNLLNPSTYVFWLTIGSPMILESAQIHVSVSALFILGFYAALLGSQTTVAVAVGRSKTLVKSKYYIYVIRVLGIILIVFALTFVRNALEMIGFL